MNQTDSGFLNSIPPVTRSLIITDLLSWVTSLALSKVGIDLVDLLGLHFPGATDFRVYRIVSYMFMRDTRSFAHVLFNMFAVYMLGRVLENVWGPKRFLIFYFVAGTGAGLIQEVVWSFSLRNVIFASQDMVDLNGTRATNKSEFLNHFMTTDALGAISGILLTSAMIFPDVPSCSMFIPIPTKAKYFVIPYDPAELLMSVASFSGDTVAYSVHLGGTLLGYSLIRYWEKKDMDNGWYFY